MDVKEGRHCTCHVRYDLSYHSRRGARIHRCRRESLQCSSTRSTRISCQMYAARLPATLRGSEVPTYLNNLLQRSTMTIAPRVGR